MKWVLWLTIGCSSSVVSADAPEFAVPDPSTMMPVPAEYRFQTPSVAAGEAYFGTYGVGDPYGAGVPYPVFLGLQALFPEAFGQDWPAFSEKFGTIDTGEGLPVGFHLTEDPGTRVQFLVMNCQICHAERVGERIVPGLGNKRLRLHAYDKAYVDVADRLDARTLGAAARKAADAHDLYWPPDYRKPMVAEVLRRLQRHADVRRRDAARLADGPPGRVATIEGFILALNEQLGEALPLPERIGWAKIPDVATWRYRETNSFDGVSYGAPVAMVAGADFTFGARPRWYEEQPHIATSMYLYLRRFDRDLPFPGKIDRARADAGRLAFNRACSDCHGEYGERYVGYEERVVAAQDVGTDRTRIDAVSAEFLAAAANISETRGLVVTKKSYGYVPRPLVDVWARGLYGHAGQWPDLEVLALPEDQRPTRFIVDAAAPLNLERVGVTWSADGTPGEGRYVHDATVPGLGVGGHPYLADQSADDRRAILEYLKTL